MMTNWMHFVMQVAETAEVAAKQVNVSTLVSDAGPVVKVVLLMLVLMSVVSWMIIFSKFFILSRAEKHSDKFLDSYQLSGNFGSLFSSTKTLSGPVAETFRAGYKELAKVKKSKSPAATLKTETEASGAEIPTAEVGVGELVERAMKRTMSSEISRLEGSLIFLATTGSAAPFIGLFGTVWGIMTSFIGLSSQLGVPTLQAVAPGIAEALIATAVGLAAAIPAVVAYNYFINRVKRIAVETENFSSDFLNIVDRYIAGI
ncbi:MAG: protein TolQ [Deltaproteobacteria bacterium]